jgi:homoserine O-acetyltransferase
VTVHEQLPLACGRHLPLVTLNFEAYGTLSHRRDNAILVCHSLTSDAHAAGQRSATDTRHGWWDGAIGPGKMLDTDRFFVLCSDALAAGRSTGPASPDPATGRPYALAFPVITVADMADAQRRLLDCLGISRLNAVIGGCLGGQQALELAIRYPEIVRNAVVITTTPATSAHTIAIFSVMRHLIRADPDWLGGDYYDGAFPHQGLRGALAAGVPLWMSRSAMEARFGRRMRAANGPQYLMDGEFEAELFVGELAARDRRDIDPNGLMYLMRAVEYFDLEREYGGLERALARVSARVLFISYRGDWRYPPAETDRMHRVLRAAGGQSRHVVLNSPLGHGAFLYDVRSLAPEVSRFLAEGTEGTEGTEDAVA